MPDFNEENYLDSLLEEVETEESNSLNNRDKVVKHLEDDESLDRAPELENAETHDEIMEKMIKKQVLDADEKVSNEVSSLNDNSEHPLSTDNLDSINEHIHTDSVTVNDIINGNHSHNDGVESKEENVNKDVTITVDKSEEKPVDSQPNKDSLNNVALNQDALNQDALNQDALDTDSLNKEGLSAEKLNTEQLNTAQSGIEDGIPAELLHAKDDSNILNEDHLEDMDQDQAKNKSENNNKKKGFLSSVKDIFFESLDEEEDQKQDDKKNRKKQSKQAIGKSKDKKSSNKEVTNVATPELIRAGLDNTELDATKKSSLDNSILNEIGGAASDLLTKDSDTVSVQNLNKELDQELNHDIKNDLDDDLDDDLVDELNDELDDELDENEKLIKEMYGSDDDNVHLDDNQAPKKGFFAKLKYKLAERKRKNQEEEKAELEAEEKELEEKKQKKEQKKAIKDKKKEEKKAAPKKEKKPKKVKEKKPKKPKEPPKPGDILRIKPKSIIFFVLFVAGICTLVQILNISYSYTSSIDQVNMYMQNGDYEKAYQKLSGMDIKKKDQNKYKQAKVVMYVQGQYDSYENCMKNQEKSKALECLIKGLDRYNTYYNDASELGVRDEFDKARTKIISALNSSFGLSESDASSLLITMQTDFNGFYKKIQSYDK